MFTIKYKLRVITLLLFLFTGGGVIAGSKESLSLDKTLGNAPATICITAPEEVLKRLEKCVYSEGWFGWSGNGLALSWGDGQVIGSDATSMGKSCADQRCHTYVAPGQYKVQLKLWHPGPTDIPTTDWEGTENVLIEGNPGKSALEIILPVNPQTVVYGEGRLPPVSWHVHAGKKLDLLVEVIDETGRILLSEKTPSIAYSGQGSSTLHTANEQLTLDLAQRDTAFRYRLSLKDGESTVISKETPPMHMTLDMGHWNKRVQIEQDKAGAVTLKQALFHPDCYQYRINWGDDSAEETSKQGPLSHGCLLSSGMLNLQHTYKKPGRYLVKWYFEESPAFHDIAGEKPYQGIVVDIK